MKIFQLLLIVFFSVLISCSRLKPVKINFDGTSFYLPTTAAKEKENLKLWFQPYAGFYGQDYRKQRIFLQFAGEPGFMGNDNLKEEDFLSDRIVGISFYIEHLTLESQKVKLEEEYGNPFKQETSSKSLFPKENPNRIYYCLKANEGFFVALKKSFNRETGNSYVIASFYKGITEEDIDSYLAYVN